MLSSLNGLMYDGSNEPYIDSPTDVGGLIGWWDFTDASTMYTDAGSTNVSSNEDLIYRIDNKAYTNQNNNPDALGMFLQQTTEANRPEYHTTIYTNGPTASPAPSSGYWGNDDDKFLIAHQTQGNIITDKLTDVTYNMDNMTMFFIYHQLGWAPHTSQTLFHIYGFDRDDTSFFGPTVSRAEVVFEQSRTTDTNASGGIDGDDESRPRFRLARGNSNGTADPTYRSWDSFDMDIEVPNPTDKFKYITCSVRHQTSVTTSEPYLRRGRLYKNGDDSKGFGPTTYTSISNTNDQQNTDQSEALNLGIDGVMKPSAVTIGTLSNIFGIYNSTPALNGAVIGQYDMYVQLTKVYEIIYYKRVLSNSEIKGVENYIVGKYGTPP